MMNLPNKLTLGRLGLCAVFVVCMTLPIPFGFTLALVSFVLAAITDYLDGEIARRHHLITDFGKLMDPLADKILTTAAFICLVPLELIPAWVVIVVVSREFLITGLRMIALGKGVVLPAESLGKHKTAWQMIAIIYFLLLLTIGEVTPVFASTLSGMTAVLSPLLIIVMTVLTVYSGMGYAWRNRGLIATA